MTGTLRAILETSGDGNVSAHFQATGLDPRDVPARLRSLIADLQIELALAEQTPAHGGRQALSAHREAGSK